ncbi:fimbrial protein [Serratia fonticola]
MLRPVLLLVPVSLVFLGSHSLLAAQTGKLGFEGALTEPACAVSSPALSWVVLPGLTGGASLTREVPFDLSIELCAPHVFDTTAMNLTGEADEINDGLLAILREPGAATGLGIALYDQPGNLIRPGGAVPDEAFLRVSDNRVMLPLRARYAETRNSVTPGKISSHAVIAVEYH